MNKYESSLKQVCLQCKTKPANCNKNKCVRYNNLKELVDRANRPKKEWNKDHLKDYIKLFKLKDSGVLDEFLDNEETIRIYLESVSD